MTNSASLILCSSLPVRSHRIATCILLFFWWYKLSKSYSFNFSYVNHLLWGGILHLSSSGGLGKVWLWSSMWEPCRVTGAGHVGNRLLRELLMAMCQYPSIFFAMLELGLCKPFLLGQASLHQSQHWREPERHFQGRGGRHIFLLPDSYLSFPFASYSCQDALTDGSSPS